MINVPTLFNFIIASRRSAAKYETECNHMHMLYKIFSETNRKTWVRENVRETESLPLYNITLEASRSDILSEVTLLISS